MEALQTSMHVMGPGGFALGTAPGAEASDNPSRPRQRSRREGIFKAVGLAVDGGGDGFKHLDFFSLEGGMAGR